LKQIDVFDDRRVVSTTGYGGIKRDFRIFRGEVF